MDYKLYQGDCLEVMKDIPSGSVDVTLTDIPYGGVNRTSNGIREFDKSKADIVTFDLSVFLDAVYRITNGTIIIFCGRQQVSEIGEFFQAKQDKHLGTVRQLIWEKANPAPINGEYVYLSGIENAMWFRKAGGYSTLIVKTLCLNTLMAVLNCIQRKRILI